MEQEYVDDAINGDQQALGELYDLYFDRVLTYSYRRTFDKQIAYDISANTFLKVASNIKKFKKSHTNSFAGWLFRIANNEVVNYYRKPEKYSSSVLFDEESLRENDDPSDGELLDTLELYKQLHSAMLELSLKEQHIVDLYYFERMSYKEIAASTGMKEGNIGVLLHRSLAKLKNKIEPFVELTPQGELS